MNNALAWFVVAVFITAWTFYDEGYNRGAVQSCEVADVE